MVVAGATLLDHEPLCLFLRHWRAERHHLTGFWLCAELVLWDMLHEETSLQVSASAGARVEISRLQLSNAEPSALRRDSFSLA
jgi:hypothetical protein